jgi:hypothetical protein
MSYYDYHPELNEQAYEEQQALLAELAEEPTGLDDHTADPGECPLYTGPLDADGNPVDADEFNAAEDVRVEALMADAVADMPLWALTAAIMAEGDDSGFDWDAWKDEMKETHA